MLQLWYVVWMLMTPAGVQVSPFNFISGPWPSAEECTDAAIAAPYPERPGDVPPGVYTVVIACVDGTPEDDPPPPPGART